MKTHDTTELRKQTIAFWAAFGHARSTTDVARVHAFQAIVREHSDLSEVTDDEVSAAYGGRGWAPLPVCWECGTRDDTNVQFGQVTDAGDQFSLCCTCIATAAALNVQDQPTEPPKKAGMFSRLFGA